MWVQEKDMAHLKRMRPHSQNTEDEGNQQEARLK